MADKLPPAHQVQATQRKNWVSRLLMFSFTIALFPLIIFILAALFGILFDCSLQAHSCAYLPIQVEKPIVLVLGLLLIFGLYGLPLTIPAGIIIFIIGAIFNGVSRTTKIKLVYAILVLPLILVLISGVIWFYKSVILKLL
jgi:hypothetical protein